MGKWELADIKWFNISFFKEQNLAKITWLVVEKLEKPAFK